MMRIKFIYFLLAIALTLAEDLKAQDKFYGMTSEGGVYNKGILFEYDPVSGQYSKKIDFNGDNGANPRGGLTLATNGKLYGMTSKGGTQKDLNGNLYNWGVIFEFDPLTSVLVKKHEFYPDNNGIEPWGTLVQASNGMLYGLASRYGGGSGTLFEFNPTTGGVTKKITFGVGNKGSRPLGSLVKSSNGKLYGLTSESMDEAPGGGLIFEYDPLTGTFVTIKILNQPIDGRNPTGSLMHASNGKLYGFTEMAGYGFPGVFQGSIFEINPANRSYLQLLPHFAYHTSTQASPEHPQGSFVEANNGKLYAVAQEGWSTTRQSGSGAIFEFDPIAKSYAVKYLWPNDAYAYPSGSLTKHPNGKLYGMTKASAGPGICEIYEFDPSNGLYTKKFDLKASGAYNATGELVYVSNTSLGVSIASFTPASAPIGTTVTITGSNFSTTPTSNVVKFNNTTATVTASTATSITTTVPAGATTGKITVTVGANTATSTTDFTVTAAGSPTISSFTPNSGDVGSTVTITGTSFSTTLANNIVKFNNTLATVTGSTATSITTTVPAGATNGKISVTVGANTATSATDFTVTVTPPPTITSFTPTSATVGTPVTIIGTNFSLTASNNIVKFNNVVAEVTSSTSTTISTMVPTGATSGNITVTIGANTATSANSFTVSAGPAYPVVDRVIVLYNTLTLNWNDVAGATSYEVLVSKNSTYTSLGLVAGYAPKVVTASELPVTGLTSATLYYCKVRAVNAQGASLYAPFEVVTTLSTTKTAQTITFSNISDKIFGDLPFTLSATASSGLSVVYSTPSKDKITITGNSVAMTKPGRAIIWADQAGNVTYNQAVFVEKTFCIKPPKPTITVTGLGGDAPVLTSSAASGNQWYRGFDLIAGATGSTLTVKLSDFPNNAASFSVVVKADDCQSAFSDTYDFIVTGDLAVNKQTVSLAPNPASHYVRLKGVTDVPENYQLNDITGRIHTLELRSLDHEVEGDVSHLPIGLYVLKIKSGQNLEVVKFLKN